jgi:hypothetical protein
MMQCFPENDTIINMIKKSVFIIILLTFFTLNIYKVYATDVTNTKDSSQATATNVDSRIKSEASPFILNIKNFILDHTPNFIKNSVNSSTEMTESFRQSLADLMKKTKLDLSTKIKTEDIEKQHSPTNIKSTWHSRLTPLLEKIELFFATLALIILSSKVLFYSISIIFFIFLIRFILTRIL